LLSKRLSHNPIKQAVENKNNANMNSNVLNSIVNSYLGMVKVFAEEPGKLGGA
jgi:hypothetical protein